MFYLIKRVDEKQANVGDRCMTLADWPGVPAGTKGKVIEIYKEGLMVEGDQTEEEQARAGRHGGFGAARRDGFGREELEYLAWETKAHPKINPTVNNTPPF